MIGSLAVVPFIPQGADAAFTDAQTLHQRLQLADVTFRTLDATQQATVRDMAELILPRTDTPGATDVRVAEFIDLIMTEWASAEERSLFLRELAEIDGRARAQGGVPFVQLPADAKRELMGALDALRKDSAGAGHAFAQIKSLTVYGYFTSERVQKDVLKTRMFFTAFEPDVPA